MYTKKYWESKFIDLNLRHYDGKPSDVFKHIQKQIVDFLQNGNPTQKQREIYSAIYNAINLYLEITYLPGADYDTDDTFLSYTIKYFNEDYAHLAKQYNTEENPNVVSTLARIKSPIKFMEKVLQKVDEYDDENRDFQYFNESLRDTIGIKFVIDPPEEIKKKGKDAESDYFYGVFYNLMKSRGINNPEREFPSFGQFRFLDVNTRYDPYKQVHLKTRNYKEGFDERLLSQIDPPFYYPETRPDFMERNNIDKKVKDYHRYPKKLGYQGVHTCVIPDFAYSLKHREIPKCIIPPFTRYYAIEYQFRSKDEDNHAEKGIASHEKTYKPGEKNTYHRLLVPFYIAFTDPTDMPELSQEVSSPISAYDYYSHNGNVLKLRNFAESFKRFYGITFEDYFNIPFKKFRDYFTTEEKNRILAGRTRVIYNKETQTYDCEDLPRFVFYARASSKEICTALRSDDPNASAELLDEIGLTDCIHTIYSDPSGIILSTMPTERTFIKAFSIQKCVPNTRIKAAAAIKESPDVSGNDQNEEKKPFRPHHDKKPGVNYQDENYPEY